MATMTFLPFFLLVVLSLACGCYGFTQNQHRNSQRVFLDFQYRSKTARHETAKNNTSFCICPKDDNEDGAASLDDRREAMFAMMGGLWAAGALPSSLLGPEPAHAVYGSDAKMSFPDVVQGMSDRTNKQCLVESLGNRECLVYREDEEKLLYKGADTAVLLERIQTAAKALEEQIPSLVETRQWNKVTGVLTGPMGELSSTMTLLSGFADDPAAAKQKAQVVKNDVFAMGTATTNKQGDLILKYQQQAIQDLVIFLKSL